MRTRDGAETVTVEEPQIDPVHAVTMELPTLTASPIPKLEMSLLTIAAVELEEFHATEARVCVLLSLNVPVATKD